MRPIQHLPVPPDESTTHHTNISHSVYYGDSQYCTIMMIISSYPAASDTFYSYKYAIRQHMVPSCRFSMIQYVIDWVRHLPVNIQCFIIRRYIHHASERSTFNYGYNSVNIMLFRNYPSSSILFHIDTCITSWFPIVRTHRYSTIELIVIVNYTDFINTTFPNGYLSIPELNPCFITSIYGILQHFTMNMSATSYYDVIP